MVYKSSVNANGGAGGGSVTLAGENYLSLLGQQITANPINLSNTNVTAILGSANGGTANGFTKFSGPSASEKTFTLPNASDTIGCLGQIQTWTAANTFTSAANKILVNNSNANAQFAIEQSGSGDASIQFLDTGVRAWVIGQDTSDSHKFKISAANDGFATPLMSMTTAGATTFASTLAASNLSNTNSGDVTVLDSVSVDFTLSGQQITADILPAGIDHNSLANLTIGDPHTQYIFNAPTTSARNVITPTADKIGLSIRPFSAQTANIWQVENNDGTLQHIYTDSNGDSHVGKSANYTTGFSYANSYKLFFDNQSLGSTRTSYIQVLPAAPGSGFEMKMSFVANGSEQFYIGQPGGGITMANGATAGVWVIGAGGSALMRTISAPGTIRGEFSNITIQGEVNSAGAYDTILLGKNASGGSTASNIVGFFNDTVAKSRIETDGSFAILVAGAGIKIKEGTNARMGVATLVGGTVAVANASVTATSRIFLTVSAAGGTQGILSYTQVNGISFTINSTSVLDTSAVNWMIVEGT